MRTFTYADIVNLSSAVLDDRDRAAMPLLGFVTGLALAVGLWSVIGAALWLALG